VHEAEVGDEDEGASTGPRGQSAIESFMQGSWVAANLIAENCKDIMFCSPDGCATPKEDSRARRFPEISRGSRAIVGDPQSVPALKGANSPPGVPDRPIPTESAEMRVSGQEKCATVQLQAISFRLSERVSNQIARCRGMKEPAMTHKYPKPTQLSNSIPSELL